MGYCWEGEGGREGWVIGLGLRGGRLRWMKWDEYRTIYQTQHSTERRWIKPQYNENWDGICYWA